MSSYKRSDLILDGTNCSVCSSYPNTDLTENLKEKLKRVMKGRTIRNKQMKSTKSSVIETVQPEFFSDFSPTDKGNNNTELMPKEYLCYGTFEPDCMDRAICDELMVLLHGSLQKSQTQLHRRIMLPQDMLHKLAVDVIRMARSEPYGLRGAVLYINLEQEDNNGAVTSLGRIECNSHVAATFEVHITLKEDIKRWCTLQDLIVRGLFGCKETELYLAPGYKLVKHKLYRSNSAVSC